MIAMEYGNRQAGIHVGQPVQLVEACMLVSIRDYFLKIKRFRETGRGIPSFHG